MAGRLGIGAFVEAVAGRIIAELLGLLRELSGEQAYYRYVAGRRSHWFPEEGIMTRRSTGAGGPRPESRTQRCDVDCPQRSRCEVLDFKKEVRMTLWKHAKRLWTLLTTEEVFDEHGPMGRQSVVGSAPRG